MIYRFCKDCNKPLWNRRKCPKCGRFIAITYRSQSTEKYNPRDIAILGGDPSL